jgi:hypothetical protein
MRIETRAQLARRYLALVQAIPQGPAVTLGAKKLMAAEAEADAEASTWEVETICRVGGLRGSMAPAFNDGRQRFSGQKGAHHQVVRADGQGELGGQVQETADRCGQPAGGGGVCRAVLHLFGNVSRYSCLKLAHEREYEAHCRTSDPVGALLVSLKRHFEDHKEGKAQEWVQFRWESSEDLPSLLFRLQSLALDLGKPLGNQELVTKFVTCLDRRLAEQTNS